MERIPWIVEEIFQSAIVRPLEVRFWGMKWVEGGRVGWELRSWFEWGVGSLSSMLMVFFSLSSFLIMNQQLQRCVVMVKGACVALKGDARSIVKCRQ